MPRAGDSDIRRAQRIRRLSRSRLGRHRPALGVSRRGPVDHHVARARDRGRGVLDRSTLLADPAQRGPPDVLRGGDAEAADRAGAAGTGRGGGHRHAGRAGARGGPRRGHCAPRRRCVRKHRAAARRLRRDWTSCRLNLTMAWQPVVSLRPTRNCYRRTSGFARGLPA